ncbi:type II toxin-antitoxin system RelE/ParE family toxin [Olsenella sp. Marseille-P4559]|uniref:type II toxin-antitoxin system RelE/ParE family toxin n=1 Tax=Olsenella sp. Marseille-P4559 TaxID=2364795 RepID=UPI0010303817|nr:type II toxin-antitoxin system RelE/ParE family toxin [Olsenella sp. Marseille-P4559]
MPSGVLLTQHAEVFLLENATLERVMRRIEETVELLGAYPLVGRAYDPSYPAACTPFSCRFLQVSDTPFTLCYLFDDEFGVVTVFDIEWSAGDPRCRFA